MFKCEYCNSEYKTPLERSQCVIKCNKAQQEKELELDRANLRKERVERRNAIRQKFYELQTLIEEYNKKFTDEINDFSYLPNSIRSSLRLNSFPNFEFLRFI